MDSCVFCKIVKGQIPSYKVSENEDFMAFLSIGPHTQGHTLVIPKKHTDYFFDLTDKEFTEIMHFSKPIAKKLKDAFKPKAGKIGVVVAGLEVPHVHIHLVPMHGMGDLDFNKAQHNLDKEFFLKTLKKINNVGAKIK